MSKYTICRKSTVLEKLRNNKIATCTKVNFSDSRSVELAATIGFDCIWGDMEHVANDWSSIEKQILAAKAYDTDFLVRVAKGCYSDYIRPLEMDAAGIMIPHIMNLQEAEQIVKMTKFSPVGRRPIDGGNADSLFCGVPLDKYIAHANKERFVMIQIEDFEALEHLDEIASLDGIDLIFFGPADFSQSIGCLGDFKNERLCEARVRVAKAAIKNNKFAGTVADQENIQELVDMGYRFLSMGSDVLGLNRYFNNIREAFDKISL